MDVEPIRCAACEVASVLDAHRHTLDPKLVARVVRRAGLAFAVPPRDIISRSRASGLADIRAAIYAAIYATHTHTTHDAIGQLLNRKQSVVSDGIQRAKRRAERDEEYARAIHLLEQEARRG